MISPFRLLIETLRLYKTQAAYYAGCAAWLLLPFAGYVLAMLLPASPVRNVVAFLCVATGAGLEVWVWMTLALATEAFARNETPSQERIAALVRERLFPLLVVALFQMIAILCGTLLLVLPGILFAVWFFFAPLLTTLEGTRGMDALLASRTLVKGAFWQTTYRLLAGPLLFFIPYYFAVTLILALTSQMFGLPPFETVFMANAEPPLWMSIVVSIADTLAFPISIIYLTKLYLELKKRVVHV